MLPFVFLIMVHLLVQSPTFSPVNKDGSTSIYGSQYGFVHSSPNGLEIFYWRDETDNNTWALQVNLSGPTATFGTKRKVLASVDWGDDDDYRRQTFVAANHIYGHGPRWITIPDNGRGTASSADGWTYSNPGNSTCGHAMSWDGMLVSENPAPPTEMPCLPANGMHTGPVIMPFFEKGSAQIDRLELWHTQSISVNFCPEEYYLNRKHDFHEWNWSNNREYMSCREWIADSSPWDPKGVWLLHWPTNTWTLIARPGGHTTASYISDASSAQTHPSLPKSSIDNIDGKVYDLRGRQLGSALSSLANHPRGVVMVRTPSGVSKHLLHH
jgi:hypothetical protein